MSEAPVPLLADEARAGLVVERLESVRNLLRERNAAAIKLNARRDFAWLTVGGQNHILYTTETGVAPLVITPDDAVVLAPINEFDRIADEELGTSLPLRVESLPWSSSGAVDERAKKLAGGSANVLSASDVADELTVLRSVLAPEEHARLEWLGAVVRAALRDVMAGLSHGQSEDDLVADVSAIFARQAVRLPVVLVASDERIERYRHPLPFTTPIEQRVMLVVVAERWGLHVALTVFGNLEPRSPQMDRQAAALTEVLARMREETRPTRTLGDVFAAAQAAYADVGLADEWTLHHQGGTIGYQARERIATPDDPTLIVPGMAFAWNPSAPGYKLEETLYLDEFGAQHVVTSTP